MKAYASRGDAAWDVERLEILPPSTTQALRAIPPDQVVPPLAGFVRDPKETLRSFTFFPITQEQ